MKRFMILLMAVVLSAALTACNNDNADTDTTVAPEATAEATTVATTEATTEAPTEESTTEAPAAEATTEEPAVEVTTEAATEEVVTDTSTEEATAEDATEIDTEEEITLPPAEETTEEETEPEDVPYEVLQSPVITTADKKEIRGYNASGEFIFTGGDAQSTTGNNMFIVTNDRLPKGKITATFSAPEQHNNDNGIIFGMVEDTEKQYFFWEDGPTYYFLFVSDDATLYLAKVSYNGNPWTELQITAPIPYYAHGDVITISVEFDGEGFIDCYANGEWLISYYDEDWSGGDRYGIRCEVPEVCYNEVIVDYEYDPEW